MERKAREKMQTLIRVGAAPEHAAAAMERGFAATKLVRTADAFEIGARNASGLYYGSEQLMQLVLAKQFEPEPESIQAFLKLYDSTSFHEFLHGLGFANKMDLIFLLDEDEEPLTWVNEALVAHLTEVGISGARPEVIDPDARAGASDIYKLQRKLLSLALSEGDLEISFTDLRDASFEPRIGAKAARHHLDMQLKVSYRERFPEIPPNQNILHFIAAEYNRVPKAEHEEVLQKWIDKITCPLSEREIVVDRPLTAFADEAADERSDRPEMLEADVEKYLDKHNLL